MSFKDHLEKQDMLKAVSNPKINPKMRTHCKRCWQYIEKCDKCGKWLQNDNCECDAIIYCVTGKHFCMDCYDDEEKYTFIVPKSELRFKMGFRRWGMFGFHII